MGSPTIPLLSPFFDGSGDPKGPQLVSKLGRLTRNWVLYLDSLGVGNPPPIVATISGPYDVGPPPPQAGQILGVVLMQDDIGGHAVTWDASDTPPLLQLAPVVLSAPGAITVAAFVGAPGTCGTPPVSQMYWWYLGAPPSTPTTGGTIASIDVTLSGALTVSTIAPAWSAGSMLTVRLTQNSTGGWAVTWGSAFKYGPPVPTTASTESLCVFFGASGGLWELCAVPILGRHT